MSLSKADYVKSIFQAASGNFLEMYDFFIYGFYAQYIAKAFFPAHNQYISLMVTFSTFAAGFLMRPIGAIILGGYIDREGRRKGLMLTLAIMAIGTISIAIVPTYESIGLLAPLLVVLGRLLQGFSAGVEVGGASVYLSEIAPARHRGFFVAWQSSSLQLATMTAAGIGYLLNSVMMPDTIQAWGWRIPFFIGALIVPLLLVLRTTMRETDAFLAQRKHPEFSEIMRSMILNYRIIIVGALLISTTTVAFYLSEIYTPTFGRVVLHLSASDSLLTSFAVGLVALFAVPAMGALSDRIGRRPLLIAATILAMATSYPVLLWLVSNITFYHLVLAEIWFALLYAMYNGAAMVTLTEIMPARVRTVSLAFAFSVAVALFGGFTPMISTWLIHTTTDKASPGYWLTFAALCGICATLMLPRSKNLASTDTAAQVGSSVPNFSD